MKNLFRPICWWLCKEPTVDPKKPENIDQALEELRELNQKTADVLRKVQQPDILRSLVISMNAGRNQ